MADTFFYDTLKKRAERWMAEGHKLPAVSENWNGETTVLTEGQDEDEGHFFQIKTMQHNGWIAVTTYYENGVVKETVRKGDRQ